MNTDSESFFDIFKHTSIKTHSKHVPTPPKVSGFHLNSSHSKPKHLLVQKQIKTED